MLIRFANIETAVIVLISVVALFFFPAPRGSFVSTHGPVAELLARTEAVLLRVGMAVAAFRRLLRMTLVAMGVWLRTSIEPPGVQPLEALSVLRI
jgi:hypothetical protein